MSRDSPLDPRLRALLDIESRREAPSPAFREKVRTAVEAQIAGGLPGDSGHANQGLTAGEAGNGAVAGQVASAGRALGALLTGWPGVLMGTIAGAAIGAATYGLTVPPEVRVVYVDRVVTTTADNDAGIAPPVVETTITPPSSEAPPRSIPVVRSVPATSSSASASAPRVVDAKAGDPDLAADRSLLDSARTSLSRGDATGALLAVQSHRDKFPGSQLLEEREIIGIQALVAAGKHQEARRAATEFLREHPRSPFVTVLQHIVGE